MGKAELPLHAPGTKVDRGYIGESVPRPGLQRLLQGRGAFIDDLRFPRLAHVAFFRSPYAHALVKKLDFKAALRAPGVIAVLDGRAVAEYCTPWVAVLAHLKGIKSPPQHAIAIERACWQGEAVAAVVAESRSQAEDAVALIEAEWKELPVVVDMDDALAGRNVIHPDLGDNICFKREHDTGGVDDAFSSAVVVVEETFHFGRHTGVCLEGRAILADYNAGEHSLTVYHATQAPHMMQDIFSRHLNIPEANVRVITKDVGGSFGIKVHVYPDEMATAAISVMLRRPVKFVADRLESFLSDIHAREHKAKVRLACSKEGDILAFDLDDVTAIGPYSVYPRTSGIEGNQVVNLTGGPYKHQKYRAKMHVVFTNKNVTCQYRAVGHPIAVALTEGIVDIAAQKLGMDPAEFRRRNLIADDAYPYTFPSGIKFEKLSHHKTLDLLLQKMDYKALRAEQAELRKQKIYRGIGLASMIEVTNPSPAFYGVGGARISAQDGATLRLEPTGMLTVMCSVTEQGQGTEAIFAQIAASAVGVSLAKVKVITGDTGITPYGGGTWASRGAGIGGEAVLLAGRALRSNMLDVAAAMLKMDKAELDIAGNAVVHKLTTEKKLELAELGRVAYFRPDTLPLDFQSELTVTRHYTPRQYGFTFTNGIQASLLEVDPDSGFVKLLKHWCVEDSGTVINPMLVDEQLRGGVVQGIGAALFEECIYGPDGQLLNGSMADYLVPMAGEMPDIVCAHVETPTMQSQLGAKGVGEAGTAGAPGAIMNAINDALAPLGARVTRMPFTPERILKALKKVD
ncbi:MAG: xanthine dehydrogenase family protein molybdopterin-binding subunit [Betaproteobacteria bacterium]|nr:xanthine dehydrogenase family protein molybdopterin-binding subunit [Betaproteobacteria bacterium]MBV9359802.1 xanthine dehydrogenase family protein molybdopterin-binding subunit [Betaproteobacteria bacterium]